MNNKENDTNDFLRNYIFPESTEEAPPGFTANVMTRIMSEAETSFAKKTPGKKSRVPAISIFAIAILIAAAMLIPAGKPDVLTTSVFNFIKNIKLLMPELDLTSISRFSLPSVMGYIFIGITMLMLFDRVLYGIFHREK